MMNSSPVLADLDGGRNEVLIGTGGCYTSDTGSMNAWSYDGARVSGWPKTATGPVSSSPLVIDADRDGVPEVYVGSNNGWIYRFRGEVAASRTVSQWNQKYHDARNTNHYCSPPDFDCDCDVDGDDETLFAACATGPSVLLQMGCEDRDLDADGDVDQSDFGLLQRCWSGPNKPPKPNCTH